VKKTKKKEGRSAYIIADFPLLENIKDQGIVEIAPTEEMRDFFLGRARIGERHYLLRYANSTHNIVCPVYANADGEDIIVIPYFFYPGRWYPVQAYLYASCQYSSNSAMGQRAAAEKTRAKFGLKYFSHSTVCRTSKDIENSYRKALEARYGKRAEPCGHKAQEASAGALPQVGGGAARHQEAGRMRRFPSVEDTSERRGILTVFLRGFKRLFEKKGVGYAGRLFLKCWHKRTNCLLI